MSPPPDQALSRSHAGPLSSAVTGTRKRKRSSCAQPGPAPAQFAKRTRLLPSQSLQSLQRSEPDKSAKNSLLSQTSRSIIESWLNTMPSRRSAPDPAHLVYLASPPADEARSLISNYSNSRNSTKSSRSSSVTNIGPENSQYRQHLSRRNCEITAKNVEVPPRIRADAMAIWEHPRSSPQMSDGEASEVVKQLRRATNENEATFRYNVQHRLCHGELPTTLSARFEEKEWKHEVKIPLDPAWDLKENYPDLTYSKPDSAFHLELTAFSQTQKAAIDHFVDNQGNKYYEPVSDTGPPFFTIEFVTHQGNSGHIWKTENQGAFSGGQCLHALHELERYIGSNAPGEGGYFLHLQMDQRVAQLSVSWIKLDQGQPPKYHSDVLQQYLLANDNATDSIKKISLGLRNTADLFARQYLDRLGSSLDSYAEKVRASKKRRQTAQEAPTPKRSSDFGAYGRSAALMEPPISPSSGMLDSAQITAPVLRYSDEQASPMSPTSQPHLYSRPAVSRYSSDTYLPQRDCDRYASVPYEDPRHGSVPPETTSPSNINDGIWCTKSSPSSNKAKRSPSSPPSRHSAPTSNTKQERLRQQTPISNYHDDPIFGMMSPSHQGGEVQHTNPTLINQVPTQRTPPINEVLQRDASQRGSRATEESTRAVVNEATASQQRGSSIAWSRDSINNGYRQRLRSFKDA